MKSCHRLGFLLLPLMLAAAAPAPSPAPMSRAAVEALGRAQSIWCENWRASDESCASIAFFELQPDGKVRETVWFRFTQSPDVRIGVRDDVEFEGDKLCATADSTRVPVAVMVNGVAAAGGVANLYRRLILTNLADDDGERTCETFYRGAAGPDWIRTVVTVNGEIEHRLTSTYRLLPAGTKVSLRDPSAGRLDA